ncbi:hypothetical protein HAX54_021725, partial [Datura stramonium]|nr:hypothetical protein [Datura stramonium]
ALTAPLTIVAMTGHHFLNDLSNPPSQRDVETYMRWSIASLMGHHPRHQVVMLSTTI